MLFFQTSIRFSLRCVAAATVAVICLFVLGARTEAKGGTGHQRSSTPSIISSEFAIGDFDGDRVPDLATVDVQSGGTHGDKLYSIRFTLTSGEAQVFGVNAPAGGLQLVARDVNGDNALDLLIRTTWQHRAIAVLLNDGHGNFTLSQPELFPVAAREDQNRWSSGEIAFCESGDLVRFENATGEVKDRSDHRVNPQEVGLPVSNAPLAPRRPSLRSGLGRAPPSFIFFS